MSSSRSLTPYSTVSSTTSPPAWVTDPPRVAVPDRSTLVDMLRFYATPETRAVLSSEFEADWAILEDLVARLVTLIGRWRPTTAWHWSEVCLTGRTIEWLAWQVAVSPDPDLVDLYEKQAIIPYAIDLSTLPRYAALPTVIVHPDRDDVELV